MRYKTTFTLFFAFIFMGVQTLFAQDHLSNKRLNFDQDLHPFYHGVASGDPLSNAVIIWTRVTLDTLVDVSVNWRVATDTLFQNVVQNGVATASSDRDYTVKVDVTGLNPGTYYYFQFEFDGKRSLIGRTKTAPTGDNNHLRFAVVSCSNYQHGYFNAYEHLAYRNDFDAVIHLGDYIYEYGAGGYSANLSDRVHEPANATVTLSDYRIRHSHYKLDEQLRKLHQQYPWIVTWDDHESANDSWMDGAENHDPNTEGTWVDRKAASIQAYLEWLPVREEPVITDTKIYRKFRYGDLADIIVLDTRLEGREEQSSNSTVVNDTNRTMLGQNQYDWLIDQLDDDQTQWKVLAQQVMMAPLVLFSQTLNFDQWDGYPAERKKIFDHVLDNDIKNLVVLTGDIHTAWANDLPTSSYSGSTRAGAAGVEFVTTSVTSPGFPFTVSGSFVVNSIPHVRYANLNDHGYYILDINKDRTQSNFYFIESKLDNGNINTNFSTSWYVNDDERFLRQGSGESAGLADPAPLAPFDVPEESVSIRNVENVTIVGAYPNPFNDVFTVQFNLVKAEPVKVSLVDITGRVIKQNTLDGFQQGINYLNIHAGELSAGNYILVMETNGTSFRKKVVKY
jgi:alkaline phosphatase D